MLRTIAIALAASFVLSVSQAANRLADSQSPYLLQHADNPVDWYPWGSEAFAKAEAENKLLFISIGYSTCHWCHVMNRESFSDEEIAAYLNEHYVCIKIDREERPDIDNVYMTFVQNLRGSAGWPLNVFLTPDKKPFFGGTYYPPRDDPERGGGFLELIKEIQGFWIQDPAKLLARSEQIVNTLNQRAETLAGSADSVSLDLVSNSITSYFFAFDEKNKGFGKGEKFPTPTSLSLLLRSAATPEIHPEDRELAQRLALETLDAICAGGIRDHVGGGFHRYTVDPAWKLPHFEKMLYDQALLAKALVDAWQLAGESRYQQAATEALDYLLRDMRHEKGGFYSAEDAESPDPEKPDTKREGAYYLWNAEELETLIPNADQRAFLAAYFAIAPEGNAPTGDFPSDLFDGYNTLRIERPLPVVSEQLQFTPEQAAAWLKDGLATLRQARSERQRPHLDDKIVTSWNGLAISALARAAQAFDRPDYADAAAQAATFLLDKLWDESSGQLSRLYRQGPSPVSGFAEDYAYLIEGLLDLYEATANHLWIKKAEALQLAQNQRFHDAAGGGFFLFEESSDIVFGRPKRLADAALPSPNAVSAKNLARLGQIFHDQQFQKMAVDTIASFLTDLENSNSLPPTVGEAILFVGKTPVQIVISGTSDSDSVRAMIREVNTRLLPAKTLLYADQSEGQAYLAQRLEFIQSIHTTDDAATAFVCENYVCQLPAKNSATLAKQLDARR